VLTVQCKARYKDGISTGREDIKEVNKMTKPGAKMKKRKGKGNLIIHFK
jgi:hypothetical protein